MLNNLSILQNFVWKLVKSSKINGYIIINCTVLQLLLKSVEV